MVRIFGPYSHNRLPPKYSDSIILSGLFYDISVEIAGGCWHVLLPKFSVNHPTMSEQRSFMKLGGKYLIDDRELQELKVEPRPERRLTGNSE